ncbi:MAG: hypothetical protein H6835_16495 [Planctomycetes bacterium]|nr:hypothetical protein [Planctomycetota bacterium]
MPSSRKTWPAPLLAAFAAAVPLAAQSSLPVHVEASVDTSQLESGGRATLKLTFTCEATPLVPYAVRVELRTAGRMLQRRDHAPPVATRDWKPNVPVVYELPLFFPLAPDAAGHVEVLLGFLDRQNDELRPPLTRDRARDGMALVAQFTLPKFDKAPDPASVQATVAAALELAKKDPVAAWDQLEFTFRRTDDYGLKDQLQGALLQVGRMPPAALSFEEQDIVAGRIRNERARYLRQVAGRLYDRGKLFGALVLLDEVGGALQEDADRAVLGALDEAQRATTDRDGIAEKVFAIDKAQQAEVERLADEHKDEAERLKFGLQLAKDKKQRPIARELIRTIEFTPQLREEAAEARRDVERAWLADVPPEERAEAEAAMNHPCWARTARRQSHRFVLIGPEKLIQAIPADSLLRFDLAYLYLTDLFGRVPNPDGDRVTVYFKELWEFGGGVGGGKIIDIGRADPDNTQVKVDGGLYYHELTHCIDDTNPIYGGMHEGLADFGAAFAYHELHQVAQARGAFGAAQRAFLGDYLQRDLEYWRIPNYGPSAGFLLHFMQKYGKRGDDYEWQRYRKFFRDYRNRAVDDGRTPTLARTFAYHLVDAFGEGAFADLIEFRWPLLPEDLAAIRREQDAVGRRRNAGSFDDAPGSPVERDRMANKLRREEAGAADHGLELGVVTDWWVIGPFKKDGVDADTYRFPPEYEIDLGKRYESINNNPTWRQPGPKPVTVDASGWLEFHFSYMDYTAIYALTHVTVGQATEAWFWLRCDDDATLFVDDMLVGKYENVGGGLGPWRPDWRVRLPDAQRFAVDLQPGRHKVLLKIHNRTGGSGCSMAISKRNGMPLTGARTDAETAKQKLAAIETPDGDRWQSKFKVKGSTAGAHRKLDATVGQWRVRNKAIEGFATDRGVEWRKYTVRPGFPKDSPSNLAWLPEKATKDVDAFRLTVDFEEGGRAPKLGVTFQGDGLRDGLGGWTLLLVPHGEQVQARLERYDRQVYESDRVPYPSDPKKPTQLELLYWGKRLTVKLGDQVLFDQAPIRAIPGKERIGIATWGPEPRIVEIELRAPARTR